MPRFGVYTALASVALLTAACAPQPEVRLIQPVVAQTPQLPPLPRPEVRVDVDRQVFREPIPGGFRETTVYTRTTRGPAGTLAEIGELPQPPTAVAP